MCSSDLANGWCTSVNSTPVALPFTAVLRPGLPLHDQVVFAATKAIVTGQLGAGDTFPSVRTISQELRINPNTAQKIVATLVERGLLDARPGIGTVVTDWRPSAVPAQREFVASLIERLVIEAKYLRLDASDVIDAIRREWK
jgi:DNA-binding transcriptional regulator YhcF (GntR family)